MKEHWIIEGNRVDSKAEMERLVLAGKTAEVVTVERQQEREKLTKLQETWHQQALKKAADYASEQSYADSANGKAAEARRFAAEHGSSFTSVAPSTAFEELDAFSPRNTDVFKQ